MLESLEDRTLLSATPLITEFMARNSNGLVDQFGNNSDWIELHNPGGANLNVAGFHLTDSSNDLVKWTFPANTIIPAGGYLVVFASGQDITTGSELHTSFQLNGDGGYLALVAPDGATVLSSYDYPNQVDDVSYGVATEVDATQLLATGNSYHVTEPSDGSLGTAWRDLGFNDSSWTVGAPAVGFDPDPIPPRDPGFSVAMVDFNESIGDIATASRLLDGDSTGYTIVFTGTQDYTVVNFGSNGNFASDRAYPNGTYSEDTFALRCTAEVYIPAGTWTLDVGSDDGFSLTIPGVSFTNRVGESYVGTPSVSTIMYSNPRGHSHTSGSFTIPAGGLNTTLTLDFYENGGGDDVELSFASGATQFSNGGFNLLSDSQSGWQLRTTASAPPPNYKDLIHTNIQGDMLGKNASAYVRVPIPSIDNPDDYDSLLLSIRYDDGFVAWLNGVRIASRNAPADPVWNSAATGLHGPALGVNYEDITIELAPGLLNGGTGQNVLAIQGLNSSAADSQFIIDAQLFGLDTLGTSIQYFTNATPGGLNDPASTTGVVADTKFSVDRGFYTAPFQVAITTATEGASIRYTTDGTAPTPTTGTLYTGPISITGTTVLRAMAYKVGDISTDIDTETYIFPADVIGQSPNGETPAGWPTTWSPNVTDYGMDPNVVNDPTYSAQMIEALKSIPTMSLSMNFEDLFGPSGIYSNPSGDGRTWERPGSLELIYPDGTVGFQANLGVRIRGGFSRSTDNPKHAFRFFFRSEYGDGKLNYPLFGADGQQAIDKFDLRTFQNYSWSFQGDNRNIFMRDVTSRDAQLAMGQNGERGNYYFLYINGQFWGIYNTDERPEADTAAGYYGGSPDDYDVIKPAPDNGYSVYATDGNMDAWSALWNGVYNVDLSNNANYFKLMGLNPDGSRNLNYPILLDVDNLIDYMLVIFYGGNLDAPLSNFLGNSSPNNFFAVRNRTGTQGWQFFVHDAEHTLLNVNEDRTGPFNTISGDPGTALAKSNPQYMFQLLEANPEFRLRVADRVHKWMFNDSVLTPAGFLQIINARRSELGDAVIAESARWGDAKREPALTFNDYTNALNDVLNSFLPTRTSIVLGQLAADNLYPSVAAPEMSQNGGTVSTGTQLSISNPGGQGVIYYTLDGTDPRQIGGTLNTPSAIAYAGPIALNQTRTITARVLDDGVWSAVTQWTFYLNLSALKITELMYNPPAPLPSDPIPDAQQYEFIELQNTGSATLNLLGAEFTAGISYVLPSYNLAPGARVVLARNIEAFQSRYGTSIPILGTTYSGALDNGGEEITLATPSATLIDFKYKDGWYPQTDGEGFSLVVSDPMALGEAWSSMTNWRPSMPPGGAPGAPDPGLDGDAIVINEVMSNTAGSDGDWVELRNTSSTPLDISGWFLSNDPTDLMRYQLPAGSVIPAGGFLTLTQNGNFGVPGGSGVNMPFSFSSEGDAVYLTSNYAGAPGGYRDSESFGAVQAEISYGRYVGSDGGVDFTKLVSPTFGAANSIPLVGPVVITELLYDPNPGTDEFIELKNLTASPLSLFDASLSAGWQFTDGIAYTFADGDVIPANGYALVVPIDPATYRSMYGIAPEVPIFGPYSGSLSDGGEKVKLSRPGTPDPGQPVPLITVDHVDYQDEAPWPVEAGTIGASISRKVAGDYGNDPANWIAGPVGGTPGSAYTSPSTPQGVSAAVLNPTSIRVTWNLAVGAAGYRIQQSTDESNWTEVGDVVQGLTQYDVGGLSSGRLYYFRLIAYNAVGEASPSNVTSAFTLVAGNVDLLAVTDAWAYNDSGTNLGTAWIANGYNDASGQNGWMSGGGLFYNEGSALPAPKTTLLNLGPTGARTPTFYFRTHVTVNFDPAQATFSLRTVLDDACAIYINGNLVPAFTLRMPASWDYSTYTAGSPVGDAAYEGPFTLPSNLFVQGDNVIAVEVHQANATSSDVVWGAELSADVTQTVQTTSATFAGVDAGPYDAPLSSVQVVFPEAVTGIDWADFRLFRNGGSNLITSAQTVSTSDNRTFVLGNLDKLDWVAGDYTLQLVAGNSGIATSSGSLPLGADAFASFQMAQTRLVGSAGADSYYIRLSGSTIEIYPSGVPVGVKYTAPVADVSSLVIDAGAGNDTLTIAGSFSFTPQFLAGPGFDTLTVSAGMPVLDSDIAGTLGIENLNVSGGTVTLAGIQHLDTLQLNNSGHLMLEAGGSSFLSVDAMSLSNSAVLDLQDNDVELRYTSASPVNTLSQFIANARLDATGPKIIGSGPAPGFEAGVAPVDNRLLHLSQWGSQTISDGSDFNQVILKSTYLGDTNLDGAVTDADYAGVTAGMGATGVSWIQGDVTLDGSVTVDDLALVTAQLGAGDGGEGGPALAVASATPSVPLAAAAIEPVVASEAPAEPVATPPADHQARRVRFSLKPIEASPQERQAQTLQMSPARTNCTTERRDAGEWLASADAQTLRKVDPVWAKRRLRTGLQRG